jgi:hypothetical protein
VLEKSASDTGGKRIKENEGNEKLMEFKDVVSNLWRFRQCYWQGCMGLCGHGHTLQGNKLQLCRAISKSLQGKKKKWTITVGENEKASLFSFMKEATYEYKWPHPRAL